jgi:hypothetical protein
MNGVLRLSFTLLPAIDLPNVRQGHTNETLIFRGVIIDTIEEIGETRHRLSQGDHDAVRIQYLVSATTWLLEAEAMARKLATQDGKHNDWRHVSYPRSSTGRETLFEAFWRTLIANTFKTSTKSWGSRCPATAEHGSYYDAYRSWLSHFEGEISTWDAFDISEPRKSEMYSWAHVDATENRRFLASRHGFIGLGNSGIREGDVIAVLAGAATPYTLRRDEDGDRKGTEEGNRFRLVGHAYIHGLMNGEGLKMSPMAHIELR